MSKIPHISGQTPFFRYLAPFLTYLALGAVQGGVEDPGLFWLLYVLKIAATALAFVWGFSGYWKEIPGRPDGWSAAAGMIVLVVWLAHYKLFSPQAPPAFDPYVLGAFAVPSMIVRTVGASVLVPLLEEVFWRSFFMRFMVKNEFLEVPLGTYKPAAFWLTVIAFACVHPMWQWPVAAFAGIVYGGYLVRTKNLWGCIVAHGVTNLGLCLYAISTGDWGVWG